MRDLSRDQLLAELRALRPEFEREGVVGMSIFGSRARGDNTSDSDLDLLIRLEPARSALSLAGVYGIVEERIGLESSVISDDGLHRDPKFRDRISDDLVRVF
jgi:predicted nucleotidyltransferase